MRAIENLILVRKSYTGLKIERLNPSEFTQTDCFVTTYLGRKHKKSIITMTDDEFQNIYQYTLPPGQVYEVLDLNN